MQVNRYANLMPRMYAAWRRNRHTRGRTPPHRQRKTEKRRISSRASVTVIRRFLLLSFSTRSLTTARPAVVSNTAKLFNPLPPIISTMFTLSRYCRIGRHCLSRLMSRHIARLFVRGRRVFRNGNPRSGLYPFWEKWETWEKQASDRGMIGPRRNRQSRRLISSQIDALIGEREREQKHVSESRLTISAY